MRSNGTVPMDSSVVIVAYGVPIDAIALYIGITLVCLLGSYSLKLTLNLRTACEARTAVQPLIDFLSLLTLRQRLGTLAPASAHLFCLPPELLIMVQEAAYDASRHDVRERLRKSWACPCLNDGDGERVEGRWKDRFSSHHEGCEESRYELMDTIVDNLQSDSIHSILSLYQLELCFPAQTVRLEEDVTPSFIGLPVPLLPSKSADPSLPISEGPIHRSLLPHDKYEHDPTRVFELDSITASLSPFPDSRFQHFLRDLRLSIHVAKEGIPPSFLLEEDNEVERDANETAGKPKLVMVHSAKFEL